MKKMLCLVVALLLCALAGLALAEGSTSFVYTDDGTGSLIPIPNRARPYLQCYNGYHAGVAADGRLYAYAKAGETICFGSSTRSKPIYCGGPYTPQNYRTAAKSAMTGYTVQISGEGCIMTSAQEMAGPNFGVNADTNGYTPFTLVAPQEGIYCFIFSSSKPDGKTCDEYQSVSTSAELSTVYDKCFSGTAAWDVTVFDADGNKQSGRVFMDKFLFHASVETTLPQTDGYVYYVSRENYVYRQSLNGMTPGLADIFCNSRGVIKMDKNGVAYDAPLYHSIYPEKKTALVVLNGRSAASDTMPYYFVDPTIPDNPETGDYTYPCFYNYPSAEARKFLGIGGDTGEVVKNPVLHGIYFLPAVDAGNLYGITGCGGSFYVCGSDLMNVSIDLPFHTSNAALADLTLFGTYSTTAFQLSDEDVALLKEKLSITVTEADRAKWIKIAWDGLDGTGNEVPAGVYGADAASKFTVTARNAEIHFPALDLESNRYGFVIERVEKQGNEIVSVSDMLYFNNDNTLEYCNLQDLSGTTPEGVAWSLRANGLSGLHCLQIPVIPFIATNYTTGGNATIMDIWTYVNASADSADLTNAVIKLKSGFAVDVGVDFTLTGRGSAADEFAFSLTRFGDSSYTNGTLLQTIKNSDSQNGETLPLSFSLQGVELNQTAYFEIAQSGALPQYVTAVGEKAHRLELQVLPSNGSESRAVYKLDGAVVQASDLMIAFNFQYGEPVTINPSFTTLLHSEDSETGAFRVFLYDCGYYAPGESLPTEMPRGTVIDRAFSAYTPRGQQSAPVAFDDVIIDSAGTYLFDMRLNRHQMRPTISPDCDTHTLKVVSVFNNSTGTYDLSYSVDGTPMTEPRCMFTAEVIGMPQPLPETGDSARLSLWLAVAAASASILLWLRRKGRAVR